MAVPSLRESVSPVLPDDYARTLEVWEASVLATHDFVSEKDILAFRHLTQRGLSYYRHLYAVRDVESEVVGFIAVDKAKVDMLFVHPNYRVKGVGARLMRYAIDELGAYQVDVNEQNEQALGFYLHLGFEVVGRSDLDGTGRPYPVLHLALTETRG